MMKLFYSLILLFLTVNVFCNMAEPVNYGTEFGSPFTADYVDILREEMLITVDSTFQHASFRIRYYISSDQAGVSIPLLFLSAESCEDFTVSFNGDLVQLQEVPYDLQDRSVGLQNDFNQLFDQEGTEEDELRVYDGDGSGFVYQLHNLSYFEVDIPEGESVIEVNYNALVWEDRWDIMKKFYFKYFLSPARYWRSFGSLDVEIRSAFEEEVELTIETKDGEVQPLHVVPNQLNSFHFDELPGDVLKVQFAPEPPLKAQKLLDSWLYEYGVYLISFLLFFLSLFAMLRFRKKNTTKLVNPWAFLFAFLIPFVAIYLTYNSVYWIDDMLGPYASREHGYFGLIWIGLPFFIGGMLLFYALLDFILRKIVKHRTTS